MLPWHPIGPSIVSLALALSAKLRPSLQTQTTEWYSHTPCTAPPYTYTVYISVHLQNLGMETNWGNYPKNGCLRVERDQHLAVASHIHLHHILGTPTSSSSLTNWISLASKHSHFTCPRKQQTPHLSPSLFGVHVDHLEVEAGCAQERTAYLSCLCNIFCTCPRLDYWSDLWKILEVDKRLTGSLLIHIVFGCSSIFCWYMLQVTPTFCWTKQWQFLLVKNHMVFLCNSSLFWFVATPRKM